MRFFQVDAFTERPFAGNPAAICFPDGHPADDQLQAIAVENNLSETAFLWKRDDGYDLRWFTPAYEVDLCGHATLASAHILWQTGVQDELIRFHTRSGVLTAKRTGDRIQLDFPAVRAEQVAISDELRSAFPGCEIQWSGRNRMDYILVADSASQVKQVEPDYPVLQRTVPRGVILTAEADSPDCDFISRFFAPAAGVNEDPVTGSAHCCLAPYWSERWGRPELLGYQASPRGGYVHTAVSGDRVLLGGKAITVIEGDMHEPT